MGDDGLNSSGRWYSEPGKAEIARSHDRQFELPYAKLMADYLEGDRSITVADIGCGYGELYKALYYRGRPVRYYGFDPDKGCVDSINAMRQPNARGLCHDSTEARAYLENHTADVICSVLSLGLWEDPVGDIIELAGTLSLSGKIFVIDICKLHKLRINPNLPSLLKYKFEQYNTSLGIDDLARLRSALSDEFRFAVDWFFDDGNGPKQIKYGEITTKPAMSVLFLLKIERKSGLKKCTI